MRFSIRFNQADPRHRKAAQLLNQAGRSKAVIVADALWEYQLKHGEGAEHSGADSVPLAGNALNGPQTPLPDEIRSQDGGLEAAILAGLSLFKDD